MMFSPEPHDTSARRDRSRHHASGRSAHREIRGRDRGRGGAGHHRLLTGGDIPAFSPLVALLDRGRQAGELRSDLPLSCQVEALYALAHACLRASELAAARAEDISAAALRLYLEGSKPPTGPPR